MSFSAGDQISIDVEQHTSDPNGPAVSVNLEYSINSASGSYLAQLDNDNSGIGGGDPSDTESSQSTILLTYQMVLIKFAQLLIMMD
ncbi:MAG: hypothetical protein IPJ26_16720 [Bacteroidetes bacterium]|nr:hypothetical protein [Bacteroidota bacterium]